MIARNVGNLERLVRLMLAAAIATWIVSSADFGLSQAGATVAALALLWNSIFGRCYLWKWLHLSTCPLPSGNCSTGECTSAPLTGTTAATCSANVEGVRSAANDHSGQESDLAPPPRKSPSGHTRA